MRDKKNICGTWKVRRDKKTGNPVKDSPSRRKGRGRPSGYHDRTPVISCRGGETVVLRFRWRGDRLACMNIRVIYMLALALLSMIFP
jgi:hypothetical protein